MLAAAAPVLGKPRGIPVPAACIRRAVPLPTVPAVGIVAPESTALALTAPAVRLLALMATGIRAETAAAPAGIIVPLIGKITPGGLRTTLGLGNQLIQFFFKES